MDYLISRAAAIKGIGELIREYREKGEDATADGLILSRRYVVKTLPAVDAVSVVLCKDCKHRDPEDKKCDCGDMTVQGLYFPRPDTWYCPNGERRDEDAACGW